MLNFLSQHIACEFEGLQHLWSTPLQVCSIAACGPGLTWVKKGIQLYVVVIYTIFDRQKLKALLHYAFFFISRVLLEFFSRFGYQHVCIQNGSENARKTREKRKEKTQEKNSISHLT